MSESKYLLCRLCKGTEFLRDLYDEESDTSLVQKTSQCIGLKICRNDGLPTKICKFCERIINEFYIFKLNCLKVNSELNHAKDVKTILKIEDSIKIKAELLDNVKCQSEAENNIENDRNKDPIKLENFMESNLEERDDSMEQDEMDSSEENTSCKISESINRPDFKITLNKLISFQCEHCRRIYKTKTEYKTHLASHLGPRTFQCKICNKCYTRADSLNVHIRSHSGTRPFICEICGRSSTKKQDLIRHMKIHSDERNYECPICGHKFKRLTGLQTHSRTHTGERPYKCKNCDKTYKSHSALRKHTKCKKC
ncbi:zinc-finger double domain-containing protein [Phthorimaea operculella]|nr:zinc-finger double domain-containing protein [Phthorimaea operculella]